MKIKYKIEILKSIIEFHQMRLDKQNWFHKGFCNNCEKCKEHSNKRDKAIKQLEKMVKLIID